MRPVVIQFQPDTALDARAEASVARLLQPDYDPDLVLQDGCESDWPADRPGRLILALSHLSRLTPTVNARLELLIERVPTYLNDRGFFGAINERFDEQQLAGHGWLVSGLLSYANLTGDISTQTLARRIVNTLFLPLRGQLASYPRPEQDSSGAASGQIVRNDETWLLSSDTYCVFIALEALVAAYEQWREPEISELINEFFDLIERDDLVTGGAQLHATMTAARCAAVFARLANDSRALRIALHLYDAYRSHARTLNSATMNWFGRPDSWTEPCAMVDTQILARELWRATGNRGYLDDAILIETNALGYAQKPGGGFGLDTAAMPDHPILSNRVYDAPWCCTMRGAVGLVDARLGSLRLWNDDTGGGLHLDIESLHQGRITPEDESFTLDVMMSSSDESAATVSLEGNRAISVTIQMPTWAVTAVARDPVTAPNKRDRWHIELGSGETRDLDVPTPARQVTNETTDGRAVISQYRGPSLLGTPALTQPGPQRIRPVGDVFHGSRGHAETHKIRLASFETS